MADNIKLPPLPENQKSFAGIPEAIFVEDVDSYMENSDNDNNADKVLKRLDEQHSQYKLMEYNISSKRRILRQQIPDLSESLQMIEVLRKQNENRETQFLLHELVFLKTTVPPTKNVCLWLGANVMLEYPIDEAEVLLKSNTEGALKNLKCLEYDQDFLRDQITTTEVNMARVYNWDVKRRQAMGQQQQQPQQPQIES